MAVGLVLGGQVPLDQRLRFDQLAVQVVALGGRRDLGVGRVRPGRLGLALQRQLSVPFAAGRQTQAARGAETVLGVVLDHEGQQVHVPLRTGERQTDVQVALLAAGLVGVKLLQAPVVVADVELDAVVDVVGRALQVHGGVDVVAGGQDGAPDGGGHQRPLQGSLDGAAVLGGQLHVLAGRFEERVVQLDFGGEEPVRGAHRRRQRRVQRVRLERGGDVVLVALSVDLTWTDGEALEKVS